MEKNENLDILSIYSIKQIIGELLEILNKILIEKIQKFGYFLISKKKMKKETLLYMTFDLKTVI